ncbi:MAG: CHAT domain-containing protein [candidate division KSB1 bacterium]|nr:CHAT domain-containing protein [candidate division KSB1 bacterium]MDZ7406147.1 CHAT domain-containing protein [candidate division KSB1 bacterium]
MMYSGKGYYDQALQSLQNALVARQAIDKELKSRETGSLYFYFGSLHFHRGEYDLALEYYLKTMAIWEAFGGDKSMRLPTANLHRNLGLIYHQQGDYDRALEFSRKSLELITEQLGERHLAVAERYNNLGNTYLEMGEYVEALEYHRKALDIRLSLLGENSRAVSHCYGNLGLVYARKGNYEKALQHYQKALAIMKGVWGQHHPDLAEIYNLIGDVHFEKGEYAAALVSYQQALQANARDFADPAITANPSLQHVLSEEKLLESLHKKAKALAKRAAAASHALDDLQTALSTCQLAVDLIDQIRRGYKVEGAKLFLAEKSTQTYEQAIRIAHALYVATGDPQHLEQAWHFAEKSRAGILLEALAEAKAKKFAGIPDSLLEKERRLRADLAFYEKSVLEEESKGKAADSTKVLSWQSRLFDLKREYETLLAQHEKNHPDYFNLKYQNRIATARELQEQLLDERTALVEYFVGQDSLYLFALTNNHLDLKSASRDSLLEHRVRELRAAIVEQNYAQYLRTGHWLYQTLLDPIKHALDRQNLIMVPDGLLSHIPFETLLTDTVDSAGIKDYRALPFVLKKHAISYAYSATLLWEMQKRRRGIVDRDYLAYAPIFPGGLPSNSRSTEFLAAQRTVDSTRSLEMGFLPATRDEVQGVQDLFEKKAGFFERWFGNKTQVLWERRANEANLKSSPLDSYRYVHFATHGLVNESKPQLSGLILAQNDSPEEDGILYLGEIYNLNLNADLAVLSACETGLGKLARGEGLIGLTRGFLYAGATNLLVSLWQVNDVSTANLMIAFYQNMLEGKSKAAALREAKLRMIEHEVKYARPYYWAPFVLIGK